MGDKQKIYPGEQNKNQNNSSFQAFKNTVKVFVRVLSSTFVSLVSEPSNQQCVNQYFREKTDLFLTDS